jgi:pilus assembly protein Flp/PilA
MNNMILRLHQMFQDLKNREDGQDLVEYALTVALIALGAVAGIGSLASGINNAFLTLSSTLATSL